MVVDYEVSDPCFVKPFEGCSLIARMPRELRIWQADCTVYSAEAGSCAEVFPSCPLGVLAFRARSRLSAGKSADMLFVCVSVMFLQVAAEVYRSFCEALYSVCKSGRSCPQRYVCCGAKLWPSAQTVSCLNEPAKRPTVLRQRKQVPKTRTRPRPVTPARYKACVGCTGSVRSGSSPVCLRQAARTPLAHAPNAPDPCAPIIHVRFDCSCLLLVPCAAAADCS